MNVSTRQFPLTVFARDPPPHDLLTAQVIFSHRSFYFHVMFIHKNNLFDSFICMDLSHRVIHLILCSSFLRFYFHVILLAHFYCIYLNHFFPYFYVCLIFFLMLDLLTGLYTYMSLFSCCCFFKYPMWLIYLHVFIFTCKACGFVPPPRPCWDKPFFTLGKLVLCVNGGELPEQSTAAKNIRNSRAANCACALEQCETLAGVHFPLQFLMQPFRARGIFLIPGVSSLPFIFFVFCLKACVCVTKNKNKQKNTICAYKVEEKKKKKKNIYYKIYLLNTAALMCHNLKNYS